MRTGTPSTSPSVKRARSPRRNGAKPQCAASASASQKPALCRVAAYSGPGFPRPTTARKRQLSLPPLGFSAFSGLAGAAPAAPPPLASGLAGAPPSAAPSPSSSSPSRTLRISSGSATSVAASGVGEPKLIRKVREGEEEEGEGAAEGGAPAKPEAKGGGAAGAAPAKPEKAEKPKGGKES